MAAGGDELVDVLDTLVVAGVDDDLAAGGNDEADPSCLKRPSAVRFIGGDVAS
jgi:hypothetical protein